MNTSNWTGRCPRTTEQALGCTGHAIELHRPPRYKRILYAICDYGTVLAIGVGLAYGFFYGWSLP